MYELNAQTVECGCPPSADRIETTSRTEGSEFMYSHELMRINILES